MLSIAEDGTERIGLSASYRKDRHRAAGPRSLVDHTHMITLYISLEFSERKSHGKWEKQGCEYGILFDEGQMLIFNFLSQSLDTERSQYRPPWRLDYAWMFQIQRVFPFLAKSDCSLCCEPKKGTSKTQKKSDGGIPSTILILPQPVPLVPWQTFRPSPSTCNTLQSSWILRPGASWFPP